MGSSVSSVSLGIPYEVVNDFSRLTHQESEYVVSLIEERIATYSKSPFVKCAKFIILPKFIKLEKGRYFSLGAVFCGNEIHAVDYWHVRRCIVLDKPVRVDNSKLYSIIESEVLRQNKNEIFTMSIDMHSDYIPKLIVHSAFYKDELDQRSVLFGYLPNEYSAYNKRYHTVRISLRKVFNTMEQS